MNKTNHPLEQEELMAYLEEHLTREQAEAAAEAGRIDLTPQLVARSPRSGTNAGSTRERA